MKKIIAKRKLFLLGFIICLCIGITTNVSAVTQWCLQSLGSASCLFANAANPVLPTTGENGAVVSTSRDASLVGLEVLKDGGNAIDAAVAVGYALAVTDPCCGNLGGGGFMTIRFADGEETFINFRETAPLKSTADMYLDAEGNIVDELSTRGYLAVGVPGTVKGLNYALDKYGTMKRDRVINPAIKLATEGYTLQQGDIDIFQAGKSRLEEAETAKIFLDDRGKVRQTGDVLQQPELAATLQQLIPEGDAFYQGEIAQKVVAASEANGGILSLEDFATYNISEYEPISCSYREYRVISSPPPGGGTTLCQMLTVLSGYDLQQSGWRTTESLHHILSSMLFAFGDRNRYLGDPDFVDNPVDKLLSAEYAESIRQQIPANQAIPPEQVYDTEVQSEGTNTTHYSVIDREGNAVAVTYTINSYFGAGVVAPGTGFLLNNEMDDFTAKVGVANQFGLKQGSTNIIEPGKRPLSSMSPTIVTKDDEVFLVTGTPGGSTIPTTVLQVITSVIDYQKSLTEAVNTPRFHYQGFPDMVTTENNAMQSETIRGLRLKGYKVNPSDRQWGGAESIIVNSETNLLEGVNDIRKPAGAAVAY
ncbi:Glutathione hydrolase proenzyme [Hyella patelloides LEGE 07179]|uniref:Glutathione hydrolase proenzyme n=1 Tax=Hyella patelloides LEGE 07179 TaxID=945734 RepID=A0A563W1T0_9CYAN|nr:gamma-glutamyltransferase [Hyella patelloides]VEP17659.1 Glutathione hydrolase proenzyme [Hyella patelloides LEGE 07179]